MKRQNAVHQMMINCRRWFLKRGRTKSNFHMRCLKERIKIAILSSIANTIVHQLFRTMIRVDYKIGRKELTSLHVDRVRIGNKKKESHFNNQYRAPQKTKTIVTSLLICQLINSYHARHFTSHGQPASACRYCCIYSSFCFLLYCRINRGCGNGTTSSNQPSCWFSLFKNL